jgi:hypothetical protein
MADGLAVAAQPLSRTPLLAPGSDRGPMLWGQVQALRII